MSGVDAVNELLEATKREELISADLVARALTVSNRQVIRDWRSRQLPYTRVGRTILLSSSLVIATYFPHRFPSSPVTDDTSSH